MGADNWGICPKCEKLKLEKLEKLYQDAQNLYGTLSLQKYTELLAKTKELENQEIEQDLCEYYDIGLDEAGFFDINYKAYCQKCEFKYTYKHSENIIYEQIKHK